MFNASEYTDEYTLLYTKQQQQQMKHTRWISSNCEHANCHKTRISDQN